MRHAPHQAFDEKPWLKAGFLKGLCEMLGKDSPADVRAATMHFIGAVSQELLKPINDDWKETLVEELNTLVASHETEKEPLLCAMARVTLIQLRAANWSKANWSKANLQNTSSTSLLRLRELISPCGSTTETVALAAATEVATETAAEAAEAAATATAAAVEEAAEKEVAEEAEAEAIVDVGKMAADVDEAMMEKNAPRWKTLGALHVQSFLLNRSVLDRPIATLKPTVGDPSVMTTGLFTINDADPSIMTTHLFPLMYSINAGTATTVFGVRNLLSDQNNEKVTAFAVKYSIDGSAWSDVDGGKAFTDPSGNFDALFTTAVEARYIRITVRSWWRNDGNTEPPRSMRAGLLVNLTMERKKRTKAKEAAEVQRKNKLREAALRSLSGQASAKLGSGNSIRLGRTGPQELGLAGGKSWTIELWVRVDLITPGVVDSHFLSSDQTVFGINVPNGLYCAFRNGKLILNLYGKGPEDPTPIKVGTWTHFALQFEKGQTQSNASDLTNLPGDLSIFHNGKKVASTRSNPLVGNADLFLGPYTNGRPLLGTVAQFRLWEMALPENMIGARMYT